MDRVIPNPREHRRKLFRLARIVVPGSFVPMVHHPCVHNELTGLRNRVLGSCAKPTAEGIRAIQATCRAIQRSLPRVSPWSLEQVVLHYTGKKRAKFQRALEDVKRQGYSKRDSRITAFVKCEKKEPKPEKPNPDPRMIQFRGTRYCLVLATWLKPIEYYLYNLKGSSRNSPLPPGRVIGKGLSQGQRAMLAARKWARFRHPVGIVIDVSRFDKHVSVQLLRAEHSIYTHMNKDPEFAKLLSWQLVNRGRSSNGITYKALGRRMSGDMNTALGNCVLMIIMVATALKGVKYDMIDDGDDCIVMVEREDRLHVRQRLLDDFKSFGMPLKLESEAFVFEHIDWCQARPVQFMTGKFKFVRWYTKMFSNTLCGTKYFTGVKGRAKLVNTIGLAELALNCGIPVLQEYALALIRNSGTDRFMEFDSVDSLFYRIHHELSSRGIKSLADVKPMPITDCARLSYACAFGLSPGQQIDIEQQLQKLEFTLKGESTFLTDRVVGHILLPHTSEAIPLRV